MPNWEETAGDLIRDLHNQIAGSPSDERSKELQHDFADAFEIDGNHLTRAPVGKPQTVLMPAWLLAKEDSGHEYLRFIYGRLR
jgi:hypothetical protein